ncbi:MAG: response regulator [SAR324 cluster bacterium]|nr:response regulator [SAR324 cluster bacterium]
MKILIIDDSWFAREAGKRKLKELGNPEIEFLEADGAQEGMNLFDQESPDMVITDLVMPDIRGEAVVEHIRAKSQNSFIVVCSANIQKRVQDDVIERGADLFIKKPFNLESCQQLMATYQNKKNAS